MLPKTKSLNIDMELLGKKMLARKQKLMKDGVPEFAEEKLALKHGKGDSPAIAAKKKIAPPKKKKAS
jgi:hypothetical protein